MKNLTDYIVPTYDSLADLRTNVSAHLADGWILFGGVSTTSFRDGGGDLVVIYSQAMARRAPTVPKASPDREWGKAMREPVRYPTAERDVLDTPIGEYP